MKLKKWIVASIFLIIAFSFTSNNAHYSNNFGELYNKGNNAYKNKNYVDALKYLYSYKVINEHKLSDGHKDFLKKLNIAILDCELKLRHKLIVIRENENQKTTSYFNGNGYEIPEYLKEFIKNQNPDKPITILGGKGHELPESYNNYLKDAKLDGLENIDFVIIQDNELIIDEAVLTKYLNENKKNQPQLESVNKAIEFQLNYQQLLLNEKLKLID
ncbi:hypothetical protein [Cyclobacterium amurskyense]|uniref:Uncharacterized protein n=1 Tax=Cyclobacterium amurskyense TaxID=320787 RepID=A0A0H4P9I9_9BACT|nr:hypothetical protein [Cyclobacterium amurskyense]AKP50834.1 hypothetical protein CA2015_1391 [Cyclobacterium amurskyense]